MASHFRVVIKNCVGHELPSKDSNGYSDPYLCFDFDHFKVFKTEVVKKSLNPKWKFDKEFFYETKFRDRMNKKKLVIECWDWDRVGSDDYIGFCSVDLHTLAYGPVHHNLPLRDGQKPAGRIEFDLYMQEYSTVSINLRNLRLLAANVQPDMHLEYSYTRIEDKGKKEKEKDKGKKDEEKKRQKAVTPCAKHITSTEAQFDNGPFSVQATLHDLVSEAISIRVKSKKSAEKHKLVDARGEMRLGTYIANYKVKDQDFVTALVAKDGSTVATVKGTVTIENLPRSAQLVGGEHNENGCTGQLLLEDMAPPNNYLVKKSTKKPTGTPQEQERIYYDAAYENELNRTDEEKEADAAQARRAAEKRRSDVAQATGGKTLSAPGAPGVLRAYSISRGSPSSRNLEPTEDEAANEYAHFPVQIEEAPDGTTSNKDAGARDSPKQLKPSASGEYGKVNPNAPGIASSHSPGKKSKHTSDRPELPDPKTLPLPRGWRRKIDDKTGNEYYIDDINKVTSWTHPEIDRLKKEAKARRDGGGGSRPNSFGPGELSSPPPKRDSTPPNQYADSPSRAGSSGIYGNTGGSYNMSNPNLFAPQPQHQQAQVGNYAPFEVPPQHQQQPMYQQQPQQYSNSGVYGQTTGAGVVMQQQPQHQMPSNSGVYGLTSAPGVVMQQQQPQHYSPQQHPMYQQQQHQMPPSNSGVYGPLTAPGVVMQQQQPQQHQMPMQQSQSGAYGPVSGPGVMHQQQGYNNMPMQQQGPPQGQYQGYPGPQQRGSGQFVQSQGGGHYGSF